jgi:hypothetical protein
VSPALYNSNENSIVYLLHCSPVIWPDNQSFRVDTWNKA